MRIAIITGASSGMGKEFCYQLDNMQFDEIWGIALNQEKLITALKDLKTKTRTFAYDLTKKENIESLKNILKEENPNVEWLINCSGFGKFGRHDEIGVEQNVSMIQLNCEALVHLTEIVLPYIQKGGRIVQIASVAGFQPTPYMAVYGASKAFVVSYSRALNYELKDAGISVTCVCPFWTKTNFFNRAETQENKVVTKFIVMYKPEDVVKKAIKDAIKRKEISICGFVARTQTRLVKVFPHKTVMKIWDNQQKFRKRYKNKNYNYEQNIK